MSQINVPPLRTCLVKRDWLQVTCFQEKTSFVSDYGTVTGLEPLFTEAEMSGNQTYDHVNFAI
jgi:hypothetical protein